MAFTYVKDIPDCFPYLEVSRLNDEVDELRNLMEAFLETQAGTNSERTSKGTLDSI